MATLRPPRGYKRGFSDEACHGHGRTCPALGTGQEALQHGWGRGLYRYVMAWASTPTKPETKAALHRAANDLLWDLADLRKVEKPSQIWTRQT